VVYEVLVSTVLIVEDEADLLGLLDHNLRQAGMETLRAATAEEALAQVGRRVPDLVLLDLMLPDMPGSEVCRRLKGADRTRHLPVVILTAKAEEVDRVVAFELGADDYVTKPFSVRELVLRLQAILRRVAGLHRDAPADRVGAIRIEVEAHRAFVRGEEISLTRLEFRLLATLMARAGRVQSREQLLGDVWNVAPELDTRTVDSHVKRLREKLGPARQLLETVRGLGYRLADPPGRE
jgi:two-component system phosphate regulon response regulator PhoB